MRSTKTVVVLFTNLICIHHHEFYHVLLLEVLAIAESDLFRVHADHLGALRPIIC